MTILGETLQVLGEILLGFAVIRVHWRMFSEHSIDDVVLRAIKREQNIAIVAILLLVAGYVIRII